jgi:AraC-like DNA-binding protein
MLIKDAVFVYHLQEPEDINWHGRYHYHGNGNTKSTISWGATEAFSMAAASTRWNRGTLFISPPGVKHRIEARDVSRPITYYAILMELGEADEEFRALFTDEIKWNRKHAIGDRYRFFFEELREKTFSANPHLRRSAIHQLASFIYLLASEEQEIAPGNLENIHVEKALRYMQERVFVQTRLSGLAKHLGLSQEHLIRLFRQKLKTTPMKYLMRLRIEAATSMLISGDRLIYQIAEQLQFNSEFHFSRSFKKHTGFAPRDYRSRFRQLIGESPMHESIIYLNSGDAEI